LKLKAELRFDFSRELTFIASQFDVFEDNVLSQVGGQLGDEILSQECLVIASEDSLLRTIISSGLDKEDLLCYIDYQYFSDSSICEYIQAISSDKITSRLWESICGRLRHHINISGDLSRFRVRPKRKSHLTSIFKQTLRVHFACTLIVVKEESPGRRGCDHRVEQ
jgi:hypothetical protein